jgi:glutathione peroxidase
MMTPIDSIAFERNDGSTATLASFRGDVLLVVNVASQCGLTPQYDALERIYRAHRDAGLTVLAFPANDFGGQEPGSDTEIAQFCSARFNVSFPLARKISVTGEARHPLYGALTLAQPVAVDPHQGGMRARLAGHGIAAGEPDAVLWNFEKFLVSRDGRVVARFNPDVAPDDPLLLAAIKRELAKPVQPVHRL